MLRHIFRIPISVKLRLFPHQKRTDAIRQTLEHDLSTEGYGWFSITLKISVRYGMH